MPICAASRFVRKTHERCLPPSSLRPFHREQYPRPPRARRFRRAGAPRTDCHRRCQALFPSRKKQLPDRQGHRPKERQSRRRRTERCGVVRQCRSPSLRPLPQRCAPRRTYPSHIRGRPTRVRRVQRHQKKFPLQKARTKQIKTQMPGERVSSSFPLVRQSIGVILPNDAN